MAGRGSDPRQLGLGFREIPRKAAPAPGSLDIDAALRQAIGRALKETPDDRYEVAAKMSRLTGDEITRYMLDAWSAPSREAWRFPLKYLPAFVMATGAFWLLDDLAARCGCKVLIGEEIAHAELGRIEAEITRLSHRKAELKREARR